MKNTSVFAAGADIKNRVLFSKNGTFYPGPDIGNLNDAVNYKVFKTKTASLARKCKCRPKIIACDLHPGYFSTRFAIDGQSWFVKDHILIPVQHHHAHIASVIAEYALKDPVIGVAFDGTGYGTDGNIWGGEFLLVDRKGFKREAHLKYRMMPGGEKAVLEPWRMVLSILGQDGIGLLKKVNNNEKNLVLKMMNRGINSPITSSAGRLFDAAAALLGICLRASYEAEGPIKLEKLCDKTINKVYEHKISEAGECDVIDTDGLFLGMAEDIKVSLDKKAIAAKFHNSIIEIIMKTVKRISRRSGIKTIVLSGGVFQNEYLRERTVNKLGKSGYNVFINKTNPVNDLNIALGQYCIVDSC